MMLSKRWSKDPVFLPPLSKWRPTRVTRKRPLSPSSIQNIRHIKVKRIDRIETITNSIEGGFLQTLESIKSDVNSVNIQPISTTHNMLYTHLCMYIQQSQQQNPTEPQTMLLTTIPLVHKASEDESLLKPSQEDKLCRHGKQCEGFLMAIDDDLVEDSVGFQCKAFLYPGLNPDHQHPCLLCLRKEVSISFYKAQSLDTRPTTHLQPYRNIIGCEGEYREDAVLFPTNIDGIADPFVAHERHHYQYTDAGLIQVNVSFFDVPFRTMMSIHMGESHVEDVLGGMFNSPAVFCPIANTSKSFRLDQESSYRLRVYYAYRYLNNNPTPRQVFWLQYFIDLQSTHLYTITPFHCGMFQDIIHVFAFITLHRSNTYQNIPLVHILTKLLPRRCQFRNMKKLCVQYCSQHPSITRWMKQCVLASLCGYYNHCRAFPSYMVRVRIQRGLRDLSLGAWTNWIDRHPLLLWYCLKEFIVVMIKYNVALYTVWKQRYAWDDFEQKTLSMMEVVRSKLCINKKQPNLFQDIDNEIRHYMCAHPMVIYKPSLNPFTCLPVHKETMCNIQLKHKERKRIHDVVFYQHAFPTVTEQEWLKCIGVSFGGRLCHQTGTYDNICSKDLALLQEYGETIQQSLKIQVFDLAKHWYVAQYQALRSRYECEQDDALDPHAGIYYVCTRCKTLSISTSRDQNVSTHGHFKASVDLETSKVYCVRKKHHPRAHGTRRPMVPVQMLGRLLLCYGKCYVLCPQPHCARPSKFDFRNVGANGYACDTCRTQNGSSVRICVYCRRQSTAQTITLNGQEAYLCADHRIHDTCENWIKESLYQTIENRNVRRYG